MQGAYRFHDPGDRLRQNVLYERQPYTFVPADGRNVRVEPPPEYVRPQGNLQREVMPMKASDIPPNRTVNIVPRLPPQEERVVHVDELMSYKKHYLSPNGNREYIPVLESPDGRHPIYIDRRRIIEEPQNMHIHEEIMRQPRSQAQTIGRYENNPKPDRYLINDSFEGNRSINRDSFPALVNEKGQRVVTRGTHEIDSKPPPPERYIYVKEQDIMVRKTVPIDGPKGRSIQEPPSPLELINRIRTLEKLLVSRDKQIEELQFTIHKLVSMDKDSAKPLLLPKPEIRRPVEVVSSKPYAHEGGFSDTNINKMSTKNMPKLDKLENAVNKIKEKKIENFEVNSKSSFNDESNVKQDEYLFLSRPRNDSNADTNNNSLFDLTKNKVEPPVILEPMQPGNNEIGSSKTFEKRPPSKIFSTEPNRDAMHDRLSRDLPRYNWLEERFQPPIENIKNEKDVNGLTSPTVLIEKLKPVEKNYMRNDEQFDYTKRDSPMNKEYGNKTEKDRLKVSPIKITTFRKRPVSAPPKKVTKNWNYKVIRRRAKSVDHLRIDFNAKSHSEKNRNKLTIPKLIVSRDESSSYKVTACFDRSAEVKNNPENLLLNIQKSFEKSFELVNEKEKETKLSLVAQKNRIDLLEAKNPIKATEITNHSNSNVTLLKKEKEPFHEFSHHSNIKEVDRKALPISNPDINEKHSDEFLRKETGVVHHFRSPSRDSRLTEMARRNPPIAVVSGVEQKSIGESKRIQIWEGPPHDRRIVEKILIDPRMESRVETRIDPRSEPRMEPRLERIEPRLKDENNQPQILFRRPPHPDGTSREKMMQPYNDNLRIIRMPTFEDERQFQNQHKSLGLSKSFPATASNVTTRPLQGDPAYFLSQKIPRSRNGSLDFEKSKQVEFGFARQSPTSITQTTSAQEFNHSKDGGSAFKEPRKRPFYDFVPVDPFQAKSMKLKDDTQNQQKFISPELYKKLSEDSGEKPRVRPSHKSPDKRCEKCGMPSQYLCSRCRKAWYCSQDCQLQDWNLHSKRCIEEK